MTDMPPAGAPAPGTYTLDPERTTIRADVKAMFGLMTVHGTFRLQSGQVSIAADPGASSVRASIVAGSSMDGDIHAVRRCLDRARGDAAGLVNIAGRAAHAWRRVLGN